MHLTEIGKKRDILRGKMPSKIEKEFEKFISLLVEKGYLSQKEVNGVRFLTESYASMQEKVGKTKSDVFQKIGELIVELLLENIVEKKGGKFFNQKLIDSFKKVPDLRLSDLKGLTPSELMEKRLFQIAVFGITPDRLITTGNLKANPEDPYIPSNLCISLLNLGNLFDKADFRNIIIKHVRRLYGLEGRRYYFGPMLSEEEKDEFYLQLKYLLYNIKWEFREQAEDLGDSHTFYNRSLSLYVPPSGTIHVFSTSSGIVIPEDYRGDIKKEKNPYRRKYFNEGIAAPNANKLPKYYQWDSEGTAKGLWEGYEEKGESKDYKKEAIEILAKFLKVPNLEITEAPFREAPWKEFFTLVTDKTLVLSERGEIRKINHGLMVDDELLKTKKEIYEEISGLLGNKSDGIISNIKSIYRNGECRKFKSLDETSKTPEEAREKAKDIVELLLNRGKFLEKREERIKSQVAIKPSKEKVEEIKARVVEKKAFARIWTLNTIDPEKGEIKSKKRYKEIFLKRKEIPLIIEKDKGIKKIYVYGEPKGLLQRLLVLLEYFLKNRGHGGDELNLLEKVWEEKSEVEKYRQKLKEIEDRKEKSRLKLEISERTGFIRKDISELNKFLSENLQVRISSPKTKQYKFSPIFEYYLVEIL